MLTSLIGSSSLLFLIFCIIQALRLLPFLFNLSFSVFFNLLAIFSFYLPLFFFLFASLSYWFCFFLSADPTFSIFLFFPLPLFFFLSSSLPSYFRLSSLSLFVSSPLTLSFLYLPLCPSTLYCLSVSFTAPFILFFLSSSLSIYLTLSFFLTVSLNCSLCIFLFANLPYFISLSFSLPPYPILFISSSLYLLLCRTTLIYLSVLLADFFLLAAEP
ncbi:unnamed protein product [Acanthosepion pharaonis]|uniref:Uncharacterized protein n=1 Tax=Acanthosepion pharaonis TaxID=158019 RepID=A0A812E3Z7_ACAPH|nr:unnamed protein product [Sepia pharaonis]